MSRPKKNLVSQQAMSARLRHLILDCLHIPIEHCSVQLGYSNSSVLRKAIAGQCFIDVEKLELLSKIVDENGNVANIHWLITGQGTPTFKVDSKEKSENAILYAKLDTLPECKKKALITLLN